MGPRQRFGGKTGTTDGLRDSWFAGFNHELLGVVWVGRDDNKEAGLTGASGALRIWADVVPPLASPVTETSPEPKGVAWGWAAPNGARTTSPECPGAAHVPFLRANLPPFSACDGVTVDTRAGFHSDQDSEETPGGDAG